MDVCRACKSNEMFMFLELGPHPPANQFLTREQLDQPEPSFPLNAHVCLDCALIQVPDFIPPDYFRHYLYVPSASDAMHGHFAGLARTLSDRFVSSPEDMIVDIGSNDGLFLKACSDLGAGTLGVEPASNLAEMARQKGLDVVNEYFSPEIAGRIRDQYGAATVIVTTNTFNHIDDLHAFVEGVSALLDEQGVFVIEVPQALELVEKNEFDTIYHEHLSEFSIKSLVDLFNYFSMEIFDVERLEIHGGSMRIFVQKDGAGRAASPLLAEWPARERAVKLFSKSTYRAFKDRVEQNKTRLVSMLKELKQQGKKLAGYGAPAKGNTLLNYCGIGSGLLEFLADRSQLKHGLYSPGMHISIVPPETILKEQPDYLLILAWNFAEEIMAQQDEFRQRGGKFILPIPEPRIVG